MTLHEKMDIAVNAARRAGEMLLARGDFRVKAKAAHDFVTEMDVRSENLLREALLGACPEDGFFGEETGGDTTHAGRWIVDPIDGTTNYIRDIPGYTISIAYEMDGELQIGVVYCPRLDEMYTAIKGEGAYRNGERLRVSDIEDPNEAIIDMSFCHRDFENNRRMLKIIDKLHVANDMRRTGSAAFDLCSIACARCDAFLELGLHLYDIAAGIVIVREAGGIVEAWPGSDPVEISCDVFAHNGKVSSWLRDILS